MNTLFAYRSRADVTKDTMEWGSLEWLSSSRNGNAQSTTMGRVVIYPGCCNPRHAHTTCEEVIYLQKGSVRHTAGDQSVDMGPGDTIVIAAGVFHNAINTGNVDAEMIVVYPTGTRDFAAEKDAR